MKLTRHQIRVNAVILIYEKLMRTDSMHALYLLAEESPDMLTVTDDVKEITDGVEAHAEELDALIQQFSPKRRVARIPKLLHAILRVAVYEILYNDRVPDGSAISEAVTIVREYSYFDEDARFVNGLLGALVRSRAEQNAEPAESGETV